METKYKLQEGKPIRKVHQPETSIISFNHDETVNEALRLLNEEYKDIPAVANAVFSKEGELKGSTPYFANLFIRKLRDLTKEDIRTTTPQEIFQALKEGSLTREELANIYIDFGFTNYPNNAKDPLSVKNPILNLYLPQLVKSNFKHVNIEEPFVLYGLINFRKDPRFEHGLRLDVNEDGLTYADNFPLLKKGDGKFSSQDSVLLQRGIPSEFSENGDVNLYTAEDGVRWFYLDWGMDLNARYESLGYSGDAGRVRATKNFSTRDLEQIVK